MLDTAEEDKPASALSSQLGAEQYPTVNNSKLFKSLLITTLTLSKHVCLLAIAAPERGWV